MTRRNYKRAAGKGHGGSAVATFRQAVDIEDAAHAINYINRKQRQEKHGNYLTEREKEEKRKITLSPTLDEWLKKN